MNENNTNTTRILSNMNSITTFEAAIELKPLAFALNLLKEYIQETNMIVKSKEKFISYTLSLSDIEEGFDYNKTAKQIHSLFDNYRIIKIHFPLSGEHKNDIRKMQITKEIIRVESDTNMYILLYKDSYIYIIAQIDNNIENKLIKFTYTNIELNTGKTDTDLYDGFTLTKAYSFELKKNFGDDIYEQKNSDNNTIIYF